MVNDNSKPIECFRLYAEDGKVYFLSNESGEVKEITDLASTSENA